MVPGRRTALRTLAAAVGGLLAAVGALSCGHATEPPPPDTLRVLFVGNSLTEWNDMPDLAAGVAAADGRKLETRAVTVPNFSLEDHWNRGEALAAIDEDDWDFVVLQQGPSSLPENREHLRSWTLRFAERIRAAGAEPALYMVWPSVARRDAFDAVVESYSEAAAAAGARLLPAGAAWLETWERDPTTTLYGNDGFHPSPTGSVLVALVIHSGLFGVPVDGLGPALADSPLPAVSGDLDLARLLAAAAAAALGG